VLGSFLVCELPGLVRRRPVLSVPPALKQEAKMSTPTPEDPDATQEFLFPWEEEDSQDEPGPAVLP
jgi:hypothetical protein